MPQGKAQGKQKAQAPKAAEGAIPYAALLYVFMAVATASSFLGGCMCEGPAIVIAILFVFIGQKDNALQNNALTAVLLMVVHGMLQIIVSWLTLLLVGFLLWPLEVILFTVVFLFLAYKAYGDRKYAPFQLIK